MEKPYLVHRLNLPKDIVDSICSFVFYTFQQCIERNKKKYKTLFNDIQEIEFTYLKLYYNKTGPFMYFINILYPLREHKAVHTNLCGQCNNFINIFKSSRYFGCKCHIKNWLFIHPLT